jgi:pimeloyl-ACP methyl ester carboxylesterase
MTLPDGRRLAYQVMGASAGPPAIVLHGTPGSTRQLAGLDRPARDRGLALIVPDRPGYGRSDDDPSGTIASGARDLGELMRHLGLTGCAVAGLSGGGPTALACGVVLPHRVAAVATVGRGRRAHAAQPAGPDHREPGPARRVTAGARPGRPQAPEEAAVWPDMLGWSAVRHPR